MAYIGVSPSNGVRKKHTYTATASQTSFSGAGDEGITLAYRDSNYVDVYQNGVKLADEDYTATSGTAIVLAQGASADDIVEIIAFDVFSVADTVSKADGGTFDGDVTMAGTLVVTGSSTFDDIKLTTVALPAAGNPSIALRNTNNVIYHQAGSANNIVFLDSSQNTMYNMSSTSHIFNISNSEKMKIDSTGAVTMPSQPAFMARPSTAQSNIASGTTIACVEVFDQNADFASSTFNAPVAGRYQLNATVRIDNIDTAATYTRVILKTSNRNYDSIFDVDGAAIDPTYWTFVVATLADMDAGDTAVLEFSQNGGTAQGDINANEVAFSGYLVA